MVGKIGQHLRENEWLMAIKQRTGIPGGACEFDLPSYHYWLHRERRRAARATSPAGSRRCCPIRDGSAIVLQAPARERASRRASPRRRGRSSRCWAGATAQMVRVRLALDADCVPEISANKYALNIRFVDRAAPIRARGPCERDVDFELTFCNL